MISIKSECCLKFTFLGFISNSFQNCPRYLRQTEIMGKLIDLVLADNYVKDIFKRLPKNLTYHNWQHTAEVVNTAMKIGEHNGLDHVSVTLLKIAALFHDTGYVESYHNHEDHSINIVTDFLSKFSLEEDSLITIVDCIEATKIPQCPRSPLAEILCDADLAHFSSPDYLGYATRLRQEWSVWLDRNYEDKDWNMENLKVLLDHQYKTEFGRTYLQPGKERNISLIESKLAI